MIYCDGITCPTGSTVCIVSKKTFGDLTSYKYIRWCGDDSGKMFCRFVSNKVFKKKSWNLAGATLNSVEEELPNPYPGTVINTVSTYGGNIVLSDEEREKIDAEMKKIAEDTAKYWKKFEEDTTNYWKQWTSDFTDNMQKAFPPGFPFN